MTENSRKNNTKLKNTSFIVLLFFIIFWIILLFKFSPEEIVSVIGVEAGYFFIFLTALIGVSGFVSAPFYMTLATFAISGEFNFFLILLIAAPARAFGDAIFFALGRTGYNSVNRLTNQRLKTFANWLGRKPAWSVPFIAYLYTSFSPLPQDILMVIMGLGKVKFLPIFIGVLLGNATFIALVYFFSTIFLPIIF